MEATKDLVQQFADLYSEKIDNFRSARHIDKNE